jgi:predicted transposase/invertase (TIGR01784 family)
MRIPARVVLSRTMGTAYPLQKDCIRGGGMEGGKQLAAKAAAVKHNAQIKSNTFAEYFRDKARAIELYNALTDSSYTLDADIQFNTLKSVLFNGRINDLSFVINGRLVVLIEHQSTLNDNMPLRMLFYIARLYEAMLTNGDEIYKHRRIEIPKPDFYVLYNGADRCPEYSELKLSDAFADANIPNRLELTVPMININGDPENIPKILTRSASLREYSEFIGRIKLYTRQGTELAQAIQKAIDACIHEGIMAEFLRENGSEVFNMLNYEFNLEDALRVNREEGKAEGKTENSIEIAEKLLSRKLPLPDIAEITALPVAKLIQLQKSKRDNDK